MRTTVDIDQTLLVEAEARAAATQRTLSEVIEDALRLALSARESSPRTALITFRGEGVREGIDLDHTSSVIDLMDQPRLRWRHPLQ